MQATKPKTTDETLSVYWIVRATSEKSLGVTAAVAIQSNFTRVGADFSRYSPGFC